MMAVAERFFRGPDGRDPPVEECRQSDGASAVAEGRESGTEDEATGG